MVETLDQLFVTAKHWAVGLFPDTLEPLVSGILSVVAIIAVFGGLFAVTTIFERKGLGRIQNRRGPNRVGPAGFLQFLPDGIKALIKEDFVPRSADRVVHFLAPVVFHTADLLQVSPYTLMMGVSLAASAAFMTPFSHKANLLVMGAGCYRSMDYVRVGTPLTVAVLALLVLLVPVFFPFAG